MNILIIESRYVPAVADALTDGATAALEKGGAFFERVSVPGALEIPPAIALVARSPRPFDGYVALGCVLGGGEAAETIYRETMRGLMVLGLDGTPIGNAVLRAGGEQEALALAGDADAGGDAARACLTLATLRERAGYLR
jgi:6,7-dimethyl-8-ribityllumazine synthase